MQLVGANDGHRFTEIGSLDSPPGYLLAGVWLDIQNRRCGIISARRFFVFQEDELYVFTFSLQPSTLIPT
jgi:hypothetical protein